MGAICCWVLNPWKFSIFFLWGGSTSQWIVTCPQQRLLPWCVWFETEDAQSRPNVWSSHFAISHQQRVCVCVCVQWGRWVQSFFDTNPSWQEPSHLSWHGSFSCLSTTLASNIFSSEGWPWQWAFSPGTWQVCETLRGSEFVLGPGHPAKSLSCYSWWNLASCTWPLKRSSCPECVMWEGDDRPTPLPSIKLSLWETVTSAEFLKECWGLTSRLG